MRQRATKEAHHAENSPDLREKLTRELRSVFEAAGCERVEPSVLQPADVFLDRSGEDIRRRLYMFTDPGGTELCLRPDLTIPTCRLFLERAGNGETSKRSMGPMALNSQRTAD